MTIVRQPMPLQLVTGKRNSGKTRTGRRYDRDAAIAYARAFWDRHCSDGYVAVKKKGSAPYREVEPGLTFRHAGIDGKESASRDPEAAIPWSDLDDCAHFVSCCIGRPYDALRNRPLRKVKPSLTPADALRLPAGGLNVRANPGDDEGLGNPWVYGIVGAPRLVRFLTSVGRVVAWKLPAQDPRLEKEVKLLEPGDVIALANERDHSHVVLYDGVGHVFCHTRCRNADNKGKNSDSHWLLNTLARYSCIRIHDRIA